MFETAEVYSYPYCDLQDSDALYRLDLLVLIRELVPSFVSLLWSCFCDEFVYIHILENYNNLCNVFSICCIYQDIDTFFVIFTDCFISWILLISDFYYFILVRKRILFKFDILNVFVDNFHNFYSSGRFFIN